MISVNTQNPVEAFFGKPIHVYTRAQAIADGVLVDATIGDLAEVSRQHFPRRHVAMTAGLFALIEKAVENKKYCNDYRGVWHDILHMSQVYAKKVAPDTRLFQVIITGTGRRRIHVLKSVRHADDQGRPCITYMLPNED
jgi:hypothetical protein